MTAQEWIEGLHLQAHPEGGYFAETFRSAEVIPAGALPDRYGSNRNASTSIYFLLLPQQCSKLHRLQTDEIWHYHQGGRLELVFIAPDGTLSRQFLGPSLAAGEQLQVLAPRNHWFGARPVGDDFSLVGCTMAPGFDFADFELGDRDALEADYPQHADWIREFT